MTARLLALLLLSGALAAAGSSASTPTAPAVVSAGGVRDLGHRARPGRGRGCVGGGARSCTPTGAADGFAYPADGASARTGAQSSSASARGTTAHAVTDVLAISLLNGEITADSVAGRAKASADRRGHRSDRSVTNLVVLGQPVAATANGRLPARRLGLPGDARAGGRVARHRGHAQRARRRDRAARRAHRRSRRSPGGCGDPRRSCRGSGGDAGRAGRAARRHESHQARGRSRDDRPACRRSGPSRCRSLRSPSLGRPGSAFRLPPTDVSAPLSPAGYVFPVYGPSSFTDTFRAPRAGVGWHHGEDIFAPLGAPLLAVADGTIFSVGWNDRGRLPALAARPAGEPVLLRPSLRLLAARRRRERGQGRSRHRLRRQHGRRADDARTTCTSRSTPSACCRWGTTASSTRSRT